MANAITPNSRLTPAEFEAVKALRGPNHTKGRKATQIAQLKKLKRQAGIDFRTLGQATGCEPQYLDLLFCQRLTTKEIPPEIFERITLTLVEAIRVQLEEEYQVGSDRFEQHLRELLLLLVGIAPFSASYKEAA